VCGVRADADSTFSGINKGGPNVIFRGKFIIPQTDLFQGHTEEILITKEQAKY